jgi:hypothetical protein
MQMQIASLQESLFDMNYQNNFYQISHLFRHNPAK